jgi:hypothetical protein
MRKPQIGDTWKLNWFNHKPVKEIGMFLGKWSRDRNTVVPAVMFKHQPKGKTIIVSVRYLLEHGVLVKPSNTAFTGRCGRRK